MKEDISIEKLPGGNLHVHIPMVLKKKSGRKLVIAPNASNAPGSEEANTYGLTNEPMLLAIAHALEWSELLEPFPNNWEEQRKMFGFRTAP